MAMICKPNRLPIKVWEGIDMEEHDGEGRVLTAEYDKHFVVCQDFTVFCPVGRIKIIFNCF